MMAEVALQRDERGASFPRLMFEREGQVRLDSDQTQFIHRQICQRFGSSASIWIFGSRLDDKQRGGDVDLYVETEECSLFDELCCKIELEERLGLPVDLIVRGRSDTSPFSLIAKRQGRQL